MNLAMFLAEWAVRSSVLILSGALLVWALRIKDPSVRLAAWTAMLLGSIVMPVLIAALPVLPFGVGMSAPRVVVYETGVDQSGSEASLPAAEATVSRPFDWIRAAVIAYAVVALALLVRLLVGLGMSLRLLRGSRLTELSHEAAEVRESDAVNAPVTLGIVRPAIVLPVEWPQWSREKLDAVLAHERSHIRRRDPAVQLFSAFHRAVLWHSPMSWFLHRRIVRVAEEVSDDAAIAATGDRALYAEVLLSFMQPRVQGEGGVPMARYGKAEDRIHRILSGAALSRGVTKWSVAAILALGSPLAFVVAAGRPGSAGQAGTPSAPVNSNVSGRGMGRNSGFAPSKKTGGEPGYLTGLGNVTPINTVQVKSRVDGQLMSVSFREGDLVKAGQVLASIDPRQYEVELSQAEAQLARDQAQLAGELLTGEKPRSRPQLLSLTQEEANVRADQANVDRAKLRLSYATITAPLTGMAGLRLIDPGNVVHASDATGIVVITQMQPIAVVFTLPEDQLPKVRAVMRDGSGVSVEAWNRNESVRVGTGRLAAIDNQIDVTNGAIKLKALFDNKDEALFPNQFVIVRMPSVPR